MRTMDFSSGSPKLHDLGRECDADDLVALDVLRDKLGDVDEVRGDVVQGFNWCRDARRFCDAVLHVLGDGGEVVVPIVNGDDLLHSERLRQVLRAL